MILLDKEPTGICFLKKDKAINYFDSFGVKPPNELLNYFASQNQKPNENFDVHYNVDQNQNFNEVICGHLCLDFLTKF